MIQRRNCPICDKALPDDPTESMKVAPFCSQRCRQVDLFRWTEGRYAIVEELDPQRAALLKLEQDSGEAEFDEE